MEAYGFTIIEVYYYSATFGLDQFLIRVDPL